MYDTFSDFPETFTDCCYKHSDEEFERIKCRSHLVFLIKEFVAQINVTKKPLRTGKKVQIHC